MTAPGRAADYIGGYVTARIGGTLETQLPAGATARLKKGTEVQLKNIEALTFGMHRPDLDGGRSFNGLLNG